MNGVLIRIWVFINCEVVLGRSPNIIVMRSRHPARSPKMSKADGLRLRRRLDEESKLSEAKPELPSDQQQQPDHCLVTPEVLDCEKRTIGNTIDSQVSMGLVLVAHLLDVIPCTIQTRHDGNVW